MVNIGQKVTSFCYVWNHTLNCTFFFFRIKMRFYFVYRKIMMIFRASKKKSNTKVTQNPFFTEVQKSQYLCGFLKYFYRGKKMVINGKNHK